MIIPKVEKYICWESSEATTYITGPNGTTWFLMKNINVSSTCKNWKFYQESSSFWNADWNVIQRCMKYEIYYSYKELITYLFIDIL